MSLLPSVNVMGKLKTEYGSIVGENLHGNPPIAYLQKVPGFLLSFLLLIR